MLERIQKPIINWAYDVEILVEKQHKEKLSAIFLPENSVNFVKGNEQRENVMLNRPNEGEKEASLF